MELAHLTEEEEKLLNGYFNGEEPKEEPKEEPQEAEQEEPEAEAPKEEPKAEEPAKTEPVEEPKPEPLSRDAISRLRFEASEAKRQAREAQEELERLKNPPKVIPAKEENYEGHVEGRIETVEERVARLERELAAEKEEAAAKRELQGAINEMSTYEEAYSQKVPHYNDAAKHVQRVIAASIKLLEPTISPEKLAEKTIKTYLGKAAAAYQQGIDPAAAIYQEATKLGYAYKPAEPEAKDPKQDNFRKVAENKKRSGMAGTSGSGGIPATTASTAVDLPLDEFARLSPTELERIMYGE